VTITELIAALEAIRAEHGDLSVYTKEYGCCDHVKVTCDIKLIGPLQSLCREKSVEVNIQ
jgi:hypothetical protein